MQSIVSVLPESVTPFPEVSMRGVASFPDFASNAKSSVCVPAGNEISAVVPKLLA